jgi:hypothetical protein
MLLELGFWGKFFFPIWCFIAAIVIGSLLGGTPRPDPDVEPNRKRT